VIIFREFADIFLEPGVTEVWCVVDHPKLRDHNRLMLRGTRLPDDKVRFQIVLNGQYVILDSEDLVVDEPYPPMGVIVGPDRLDGRAPTA